MGTSESERTGAGERISDPSIVRFRAVIAAGLGALEERREEVNQLDVAGVADGDTGDNMVLTLRAVLQELDRLAGATEGRTIDEIGRDEIVASVARAALLGARGNSGVILSQLIRGAAEELASRPGQLIDPALIGAALARAVDQAYGSVREPAEGTMLSVVREMAHRVASELAHRSEARLTPDATALEQDLMIVEVIQSALLAGEDSVARSPDRLAALRDAGVVDAGGYGLVVLMAGIIAGLRGAQPTRAAEPWSARVTRPQHTSATYRYCTNFAVTGGDLAPRGFISALEEIGDSVLVVGDAATLKVHVHTDDPAAATALFDDAGAVSHLDVADMTEQVIRRDTGGGGTPAATSGLLAVLGDDALTERYEKRGALVLDGAAPEGPSTYELLAAAHAIAAEEIVVLVADDRALAAPRRAAALSHATMVVVGAGSAQDGLAAAAVHDPGRGAAENAAAMTAALRSSPGSR